MTTVITKLHNYLSDFKTEVPQATLEKQVTILARYQGLEIQDDNTFVDEDGREHEMQLAVLRNRDHTIYGFGVKAVSEDLGIEQLVFVESVKAVGIDVAISF